MRALKSIVGQASTTRPPWQPDRGPKNRMPSCSARWILDLVPVIGSTIAGLAACLVALSVSLPVCLATCSSPGSSDE
jgi:hypothetical protein